MSNPTEKFAAEVTSTIRRINQETKGRRHTWGFIKVNELGDGDRAEQEARARMRLKAEPAAPVRFGPQNDLAAVWMLPGEPDHEPEFPVPLGELKPTWAFVTKNLLDRRMPLGAAATANDYTKLALEHFGLKPDDVSTPTRLHATHVAVWLHDGPEEGEPQWPSP